MSLFLRNLSLKTNVTEPAKLYCFRPTHKLHRYKKLILYQHHHKRHNHIHNHQHHTHLLSSSSTRKNIMTNQKEATQNIIASVGRPSPISSNNHATSTTTTAGTISNNTATTSFASSATTNTTTVAFTAAQKPQKQEKTNSTNEVVRLWGVKASSNNATNHQSNDGQNSDTKNAIIISQLQHLQSPPPQQADGDLPITSVTKTRHRGFLSQLLCCFRPSSPEIHQDPDSIYNSIRNDPRDNSFISFKQKNAVKYLLPARKPSDNRICLVIDLDETLVHSSFKPIDNADFIVPVEIDGNLHNVYVLKRPHVDEFLKKMGKIYECILFTASLAKYADPVADLLDRENIFKARLFRESCAFYRGNYVKDLSRLGRDLNRVIIVDNSPASYIFHPDNAVSFRSLYLIST